MVWISSLPAELGARHQGGQVQQVDLLVPQLRRHLPPGDPLGDALGDGGLADARLADQAGVVLLPPGQDLDGAVDLTVPPDDVVEPALPRFGSQVLAVGVEVLAAGLLFVLPALAALAVLGILAALGVLAVLPHDAQREGGVAPRGEAVVPVVVLVHVHQGGEGVGHGLRPHLLQHAVHPVFHAVHILFGHAQLLHHILHRLDVQLAGAVQTVALLLHLAILHPLDEDDGRPFFASNADHKVPPFISKPPASQKRVDPAECLVIDAAAQQLFVEGGQVAAGDDDQRPHHAQQQKDVRQPGGHPCRQP